MVAATLDKREAEPKVDYSGGGNMEHVAIDPETGINRQKAAEYLLSTQGIALDTAVIADRQDRDTTDAVFPDSNDDFAPLSVRQLEERDKN